jgi:phosphatidylglycerol:prolipoprotein diacylglycerol transferase
MTMNPSNYTTISFPFFGIEFDPPRLFEVGPLDIRLYALCITLGLVLAVLYGRARSREFGLEKDDLLDGVLYVTPFAILCARLYYCAFSWEDFASDPIRILYIWEGGLAIYGGVLGAIAGVAVFCKLKKIPVATVLDVVSIGFLIGQSLGRWGNFFNREAFGAPTESFLRMGLYNRFTQSWEYYHPTFLYESVWNAIGFVLLHFLSKRRKFDGQVALLYAAWYGLGRAFIEGLRMDSLYWGPFRVSQLLAAVSCGGAVMALLWMHLRKPDPKNLFVHRRGGEAV